MPIELMLPVSMAMGLLAWALIIGRYVHPLALRYSFSRVVEPLLFLHCFRYIGLMFLIPGVTSEPLDSRFAVPAAYGNLLAAVLAFVAIAALRWRLSWAVAAVALFNVVGLADLINAVGRGLAFSEDGDLGATYWIPATIVPLLVSTHVYMFYLLSQIKTMGTKPLENYSSS